MRRKEFEVVRNMFHIDEIDGDYELGGKNIRLYRWGKSYIYFSENIAFIVGNLPLSLGYRLFQRFGNDKSISFLNDDDFSREIIKTKYHRAYAINSLKTLLDFLHIVKDFKLVNGTEDNIDECLKISPSSLMQAQLRANSFLASEIEQSSFPQLIPKMFEEPHPLKRLKAYMLDFKNLFDNKDLKSMPQLPKINYKKRSVSCRWLLQKLRDFDDKMTVLQRGRLYSIDLLDCMKFLDIDADLEEHTGRLTIKNPETSSLITYTYKKSSIVYDFLYKKDDLSYFRIRHICTYGFTNIPPSCYIEITPVITPRTIGPTAQTLTYDVIDDLVSRDKRWNEPTDEDYLHIAGHLAYVERILDESINCFFPSEKQSTEKPFYNKPKN